MHAVSQIIDRNLHRIDSCDSALWINPEADSNWQGTLANCRTLQLFNQDYGAHTLLQKAGADVEFAAFPQLPTTKYDWIIVNLPRQKALLSMMLDCASALLSENGVLWLAGENRAGIKSADKLLGLHFAQVRKLDNARHCTLYEATSGVNREPFNPINYQQTWKLDCHQSEIEVVSYPGVFAHGRLDPGSALLLRALMTMELEGDVLDFACGAGVLGACIAANHAQANLTLLDTNALALTSSEATLALNHLSGSIQASDGLTELKGSYDVIVSNPPIHAGYKTDNQLGRRLLETVPEFINPGGMLILVANLHLPYENWLSKSFRRSYKLIANDNFKVIVAKR
jgi:16S rRNA (guanine1207-N2)-methyltransferase